jgi:hypothetical protein
MSRSLVLTALIAGTIGLVVGAVGGFFAHSGLPSGEAHAAHDAGRAGSMPHAPGKPPGLREVAHDSGIDFRMSSLPNEQGEVFKLNLYDHGCGVVVGDYNGDGYDDIYFLNQLGRNALYKNKGDGTFIDVTQEAGVALGDRICVAGTFADYDNDGDQDLFVTSTRGGNVLFQNQGNGRFVNVTREAGVARVAHSQTAVFFDYDNDGYLDLFVTNSASWTTNEYDQRAHYYPGGATLFELVSSPKEYNILYHNNRDGTFSDVTETAGLRGQGWGGDTAVFDYDGDGRLDLFVTNMFGASQLYRNEGNGTFTDVTRETLGRTSWGAIGAKCFDLNNDGQLDLCVVDMHSDMWMASDYDPRLINDKRKYRQMSGPKEDPALEQRVADQFRIRYNDVVFGNTLFKNRGDGTFEEISDRANMETFWPWGVATGDFNNDGYEDVFLPSGMGLPYFYWHSYLMMNNGNETFTDRSATEGIDPPPGGIYQESRHGEEPAVRSSRCAATADFDGDGRLDLVVNKFNERAYYYKNEFPRKNYAAFRLTGGRSNRDAIGALVRLYAGPDVLTRQVQAAGGYLSQGSKTIHFGLGDRRAIDRVEIQWPSGVRQVIEHPEPNRLHAISEPEA